MNTSLPTHIGGYQKLEPEVIVHDDDIFVMDGKPAGFLRDKGWQGMKVGDVERESQYNIYRKIPVTKQGDNDETGWKKVATGGRRQDRETREFRNELEDAKAHLEARMPRLSLPTDAGARKRIPVATGFCDYFPRAIAAVAAVSIAGNEQHNPGKPLHWDRSKSGDEADALMRHFLERGKIDSDGQRHSSKLAWRAMALLEKELEAL